MKTTSLWRGIAMALGAMALGAGLAYAKLPQPPMDDAAKAKAEEAKAKAAETAKKARVAEEAAMDRVAERYKKAKGITTAAAAEPAKKKK